jgi:hypothetical protein
MVSVPGGDRFALAMGADADLDEQAAQQHNLFFSNKVFIPPTRFNLVGGISSVGENIHPINRIFSSPTKKLFA